MSPDAMRLVCAGDLFIGPDLLADALVSALEEAGLGTGHEVVRLCSGWPDEPFRDVDGVRESAGDVDGLVAAVDGAHALVTHLAPVTASVLAAGAGSLRVVGSVRGGPVNVDVEAATRLGIPVTYLPGRNLGAVAEYCLGTMICAMRGLPVAARGLRAGRWDATGFRYENTGLELSAATVGLVGLGAVGLRVAELLAAFGSTVVAYDPFVEASAAPGVRLVSLDELLATADVVSVHARLSDDTRGMFGDEQFGAMREGAVFVNTARGELVDTDALDRALASGRLRAAVLDVFEPEPPPPDHPILDRPTLLATPHLAGASRQVAERSASRVAAEVARVLGGRDPHNRMGRR